jgi:hypothetical protein
MSEAHDTEGEKCELPETDEMGAGISLIRQRQTFHYKVQKASKQGRRDIITMYMCLCVSRYCQPLFSLFVYVKL